MSSSTATTSSSSRPEKLSILFVCLGNICRSPMAEAVLRHLVSSSPSPHLLISRIDSAGTGAYHVHSPPDERTTATLLAHGITDYTHGARKICAKDFEEFDYIFAMDGSNLRDLQRLQRGLEGKSGTRGKARVMLYGEFGGRGREQVGDPYYGEDDGFEDVFQQVERFGRAFWREVVEKRDEATGG